MGKYFSLLVTCVIAISMNAQTYEKLRNQRFEVVELQKNNTTIYAQGDPIIFYAERNTRTDFHTTVISSKGYSFNSKVTHIDGKLIAFGNEQRFNSDSISSKSISDSAFILNLLNKELIISIENNQLLSQQDSAASMLLMLKDDPSKFFLPYNVNELKLGQSWSDSIIGSNSKTINQYIVTKTTPDFVELRVYKEIQQQTRLEQDGKTVVQDLKGFSTSVRWYNAATQLLKNETSTANFSGTNRMGDQSLPITITIQTSVQLSEKK
ncbi:MAG: hypothetical protein EAZ12_01580 [Sphingobacteriia bacterium]|nr:MAG: hypothetical protein EAZ12_01580 [Sphingobacteriia bacterium]